MSRIPNRKLKRAWERACQLECGGEEDPERLEVAFLRRFLIKHDTGERSPVRPASQESAAPSGPSKGQQPQQAVRAAGSSSGSQQREAQMWQEWYELQGNKLNATKQGRTAVSMAQGSWGSWPGSAPGSTATLGSAAFGKGGSADAAASKSTPGWGGNAFSAPLLPPPGSGMRGMPVNEGDDHRSKRLRRDEP